MRTRHWLALLVAITALASGGVSAHDFPVDTVMIAFVKVEAHDVHLLLRVPLDVLDAARFPTNGVNEIDLAAAGPALERVQKVFGASMLVWEGGRRILPSSRASQLALPSDRSFASYAGALSHFRAASAPETAIYYGQGYVDLHFTYAIASPKPALSLQTTFGPELGDRLKLDLQYLPVNEPGRPYVMTSRSGRVALDPTWSETLAGFGLLGVTRIVSGLEYLLFLVCLIVPLPRVRHMVPVVAAFTIGHSMTLVAAAYGLTPAGPWFLPLVDTLMAASIVAMAVESVVDVTGRRRWPLAALSGLVYGVGFSSALRENFQFAGSHLLASVFFFNMGIEVGQLAVITLIVAWRSLLLRGAPLGRTGVAILSVIVGHTAWHWMIDQGEVLWRTEWPAFDAVSLTIAARVAAGILVVFGASRLVRPWIDRSAYHARRDHHAGRLTASYGSAENARASWSSDDHGHASASPAVRTHAKELLVLKMCLFATLVFAGASVVRAINQSGGISPLPQPAFHHIHINSVDPDRSIAWYSQYWPKGRKTTFGGFPAFGDGKGFYLLYTKVSRQAPGAFDRSAQRSVPQSAFWTFGSTFEGPDTARFRDRISRLDSRQFALVRLYGGPDGKDTATHALALPLGDQLATGTSIRQQQAQREKESRSAPTSGLDFGYLVDPDGMLVEVTAGKAEGFREHTHFWAEKPLCTANWHVEHLGAVFPPNRNAFNTGLTFEGGKWNPCDVPVGEVTFPTYMQQGQLRIPAGNARIAEASWLWYPRQCRAGRCGPGNDGPLARSRGQVVDHVGLSYPNLDPVIAHLKATGVRILEGPYKFADTRAVLIEDPDGLAFELIEGKTS